MEITRSRRVDYLRLFIVFVAAGLYLVWLGQLYQKANQREDQVAAAVTASTVNHTQHVLLGGHFGSVLMLRDNPLRPTSIYAYVSSQHQLADDFSPQDLVKLSLPHAASDTPPQLTRPAALALASLFVAAEKEGHPLIVASAYRSLAEQRRLLESYRQTYGAAAAQKYVALPGASEHHTGLAVDINTHSSTCETDATACSISPATATWLAQHAPEHGFIIRYPEGKEAITGIGYEPWHLRYIGDAAKNLAASGLTYDEFAKKADPSLFED